MMPETWLAPPWAAGPESRWMNELFSRSKSSGEPLTEASDPTPAPLRDKPLTSLVETKPGAFLSNLKTTPLPLTMVGPPPPPPLPASPPVHEPATGPWYGAKTPPPLPIQTPAVRLGHEFGWPPVHRSKSAAVS